MKRFSAPIAALAFSLLVIPARWASAQSWSQSSPPVSPAGRIYHALAYDSQRGLGVLFGGYSGTAELGDTWEWDPAAGSWLQRSPANRPQNRQVMACAYDAARGRTVLWGGVSNTQFLADTWEWDGTNWTQRTLGGAMLGRCGAALVYDSQRQRCILFGGQGTSSFSNDVWEWDGLNWVQVHAGGTGASLPSPRFFHGMVYDSVRGRVVVFGGSNGASNLSDTWSYDPQSRIWTQIATTGPSARSQMAMVYDPNIDKTIVYGGEAVGATGLGDVWVLDGANWLQSSAWAPPARRRHALAYGAGFGRSVMFGGLNGSGAVVNETWILDTGSGVADDSVVGLPIAVTAPPVPVRDFAMAQLPGGGVLVAGGATAAGRQPFTYVMTGTVFVPQYPNVNPAFRDGASLTLDAARGNNVLFGGRTPLGVALGDTWVWQQSQWILQSPASAPSPRSGHGAVYDPQSSVVLLFGGRDAAGNALGDFWEWNGTTWAQRGAGLLPPARWGHVIVRDDRRERVVLHGGRDGANRLSDVWEYDGTNWIEASAVLSPSERHGPSLVRDAARDRLVLFGGRDGNGFLGDTWELMGVSSPVATGVAWSTVATATSPSMRNSHGAVYDLARSRVVTFGGFDGTTYLGDTWSFDGTNWSALAPATSPPARSVPGMCYDSARAVTVLFGGNNASPSQLNDTWEWNGVDWTQRVTAVSPQARINHAMTYDTVRQRTVMFGGRSSQGVLLADTWEYDGVNWVQRSTGGPSPRQCAMMCFDPVRNETVLFGGGTPGVVNNETWVWNGTSWSQRLPGSAPSPRLQGGMVFDPSRGKVVLYGGGGANWATNFSDTWEWDGATWSPVSLVRADGLWNPGPRESHAAAYDPRSERVVLFGGEDASGCLGDVWSWSGASWVRHVFASGGPSARSGLQMWHDEILDELLLFGGGCSGSFNNDLWALHMPVYSRSESYGVGCVGSLGMPTLTVDPSTAPVIGTTLELIYDNVPGSFIPAVGAYGYSRTTWLGLPLPVSLGSAGLQGCYLLQSAEEFFTLPAPQGTGSVRWVIPIANDPSMLAAEIFFQTLHIELPGFPNWGAMSNGVAIRVGDR